ncbi:hypothetical protein GCM10018790_50010 [Kitasatospora xanthocidica]|uniref:hypothetical protein n=1 Tax=Kitasatospora xanthocidica TaxID=83382 RepID=UPI001672D901|nr:hypothetical protein [Kitasatospora xanthocidica]GHF66122.1 hypothetical protein GCM10018790_50010 [Kitasatospora xanthocidica]
MDALDATEELWRLEPDWNRSYRRLLPFLAVGGTLVGPANRSDGEVDRRPAPAPGCARQDKNRTDGKPTDQPSTLHRHTETVAG